MRKASLFQRIAVFSYIFAVFGVQAQPYTVVSPEAQVQEGLRRQEERLRSQQDAVTPKLDVLKPATATPFKVPVAGDDTCFVVNDIRFTGNGAGRFAWLKDTARPYVNRCVGVNRLTQLVTDLDEKLLALGFVTTRASLPQQNLQFGQLLVNLHVGRIAEVRMVRRSDSEGDNNWGTWKNAFPINSADVLNIRDLEQGVEQMNRLPSQNVTTRLIPGAEPDTTVVIIARELAALSDRIRGGISLDNSGGRALGRAQFSGNLSIDNLAGLNDLANVSLSSNLEQPDPSHRSQSIGLNYSLPWGYNTLSFNTSQSRFAQYVQGTTVRFLSSGTSRSGEVRLARTLLRTSSAKLGAHTSVSVRRANSYLDDVELLVQRRRTTTLEAGLSYKQLFERSSLELDLATRRGMPWLQAQEDFQAVNPGDLTLRPRIVSASAAFSTAFAVGSTSDDQPARTVQYSALLRGQHTRSNTLSIDQFAIGGRGSVRGFDGDAVLIAESGFVLRNEWTTPLKLVESIQSNLVLGFDIGRVFGPSDVSLVGRQLAGLAVGLRGRVGAMNFDVSWAHPLSAPSGFKTKSNSLYASATYAF